MLFPPPIRFALVSRAANRPSPSRWKRATAPRMTALITAASFAWGLASIAATPGDAPAPAEKGAKAAAPSYYLVQRISLTTATGIRSLEIATEVMLVKRGKNGMLVRLLDGTELQVSPGQLTQDAALAQRLADEERGRAAAIAEEARARAEALTAAESARREKESAAADDYVRRAQSAAVSAPAAPVATPRPWVLQGSALDEKPKAVAVVKIPPKKKK